MLREQALIVAYAQLAICESEGRDRREVMTLPPMENDPRNRETAIATSAACCHATARDRAFPCHRRACATQGGHGGRVRGAVQLAARFGRTKPIDAGSSTDRPCAVAP